MDTRYDVIVVGAGHAGVEAALAASRIGARVLVLTPNLDRIAHMACNCSIGGPAKGHIVHEVDALGGEMGRAADHTYTHIRMLNTGKGPAVQALRIQADKRLYEQYMKERLESAPNVRLLQSEVTRLRIQARRAAGVETAFGEEFESRTVVIASGTFLRARVFYGHFCLPLGRAGEAASDALGDHLELVGLPVIRLKTGTVPRVLFSSLRLEGLEKQESEDRSWGFGWEGKAFGAGGRHPCYLTAAGPAALDVVRRNLSSSALFGGLVSGPGPRYCPSIEVKVHRFPERESHPVFLEREGVTTEEVYVQGLSNSLPPAIQREMLHAVPGLERAHILRYGYAVEYDAFDPRRILPTLESEIVPGLFLAGQVNGTSGYEEAAAQGIIAGASAALVAGGGEGLVLNRLDSYSGVMVADLTEKGVDEPYRMMTARAANRLALRASSAPERLTPLGRRVGLVGAEQWAAYEARQRALARACEWIESNRVPESLRNAWPVDLWGPVPNADRTIASLLERPPVDAVELLEKAEAPEDVLAVLRSPWTGPEVEARYRYRGYIERERLRLGLDVDLSLAGVDFSEVPGLKSEARDRLLRANPSSLAEARRMRGITPADLDALEMWARRRKA